MIDEQELKELLGDLESDRVERTTSTAGTDKFCQPGFPKWLVTCNWGLDSIEFMEAVHASLTVLMWRT